MPSQLAVPIPSIAPAPSAAEWDAMRCAWLADESEMVNRLAGAIGLDDGRRVRARERAVALVERVRDAAAEQGMMEAFMREYDLSSEEGIVLMCLAEALLRIPDDETAEKLIGEKLGQADWEAHLGRSSSLFVNASTWGLMLTGRLIKIADDVKRDFRAVLARLANRSGEPVIRLALRQAMRIMGQQYVMGRTIAKAVQRAARGAAPDDRFSYDMLGEAALTAADASRYFEAYRGAIAELARGGRREDVFAAPSVSIKLSALHPRYEYSQRRRLLAELPSCLIALAAAAREANLGLTIDAEEADRLELGLEIFAGLSAAPELAGWDGLGLAVQAYQKRAFEQLAWLAAVAGRDRRRIPLRLVKGAYWDSEIKHAQVEGLAGYPVFTRKCNTDISYLACARRLLAAPEAFYPQFATHNAHTIAAIAELAELERGTAGRDFEYQRLKGMGRELYAAVRAGGPYNPACRIYAPVGRHEDLLPYLVRRLLENGANTSFVNRITDPALPAAAVVEEPIEMFAALAQIPHPRLPVPRALYPDRRNSAGVHFADGRQVAALQQAVNDHLQSLPPPAAGDSAAVLPVHDPAHGTLLANIAVASGESVAAAIGVAAEAQPAFDRLGAEARAGILERAADLFEERQPELLALLVREAGKTLRDGIAEVREAADFCRYYAVQARRGFGAPQILPGPTGEHNELALHGRGVFACISPWNFPLAIFTGQVAAALAAGNTVVAKPAPQTPLVAERATALLNQAGLPPEVLHLLPGGAETGAALVADPRLAGVAFTGSTATARAIARTLAARDGPLAVLIAETGGQNAMIADSSALPEQLIKDAVLSAFGSAGQRCSALRILGVQQDIADRVCDMLAGALAELKVGDPGDFESDVGPLIDEAAKARLTAHDGDLARRGRLIARARLAAGLRGHYFAPVAYEIDDLAGLESEVFGPILHVIRYPANGLDELLDRINALGYGLTLGIHSRIDRTIQQIARRMRAGNVYVNRNMIGAVVGVQPFGGEGLSGTGPKAGGPHYLLRFASERTLTVNSAAIGGNARLLALAD